MFAGAENHYLLTCGENLDCAPRAIETGAGGKAQTRSMDEAAMRTWPLCVVTLDIRWCDATGRLPRSRGLWQQSAV